MAAKLAVSGSTNTLPKEGKTWSSKKCERALGPIPFPINSSLPIYQSSPAQEAGNSVVTSIAQHHWPKPSSTFEQYLQEQQTGERVVWVAHVKDEFTGVYDSYMNRRATHYKILVKISEGLFSPQAITFLKPLIGSRDLLLF